MSDNVLFGEVVNFLNSKRKPLSSKQRENRKGIFPYYGASDIVDYIDDYIFDGRYLLISEDGENLKSRKTPIAFIAQGKFWVNNHAHIIEGYDDESIDYLRYYFSAFNLTPYLTGAVQPKLSKKVLEKIEIKFPSYERRKFINETLGILDKKIQLNTETNQTLEAIAQALFKSWFIDFDPVRAKAESLTNGKTEAQATIEAMKILSGKTSDQLTQLAQDNPKDYQQLQTTAEAFPSGFDDTGIPLGWEMSTIGESYQVVMGQSPKGETYNETGEGTLFFQGRAEFGWRYPTPRLFTTDPKRMAEKNSVLMSVRAPVGDLNVALEKCCIGRGLSALNHKSDSFSFTLYQMQSVKRELDLFNGEGTVFGSINQKDLKAISVILPPIEIIEFFNGFCSKIDVLIENNEINSLTLEKVRDVLLPRLLNKGVS